MDGKDEIELAGLMRAAIAGDERAYATFLHRAATLVRSYCRNRISHGGIDPEDIVQETLLAMHLKRHTWRQVDPIAPWIFGIARYKLVDAFRRRGRRIEIDIDDVVDGLAAPEHESVTSRDIGRALETLPPGQKAVVSAISLEGNSIGEAAVKLGISESAVRVALHRGLRAVAQRFKRS